VFQLSASRSLSAVLVIHSRIHLSVVVSFSIAFILTGEIVTPFVFYYDSELYDHALFRSRVVNDVRLVSDVMARTFG